VERVLEGLDLSVIFCDETQAMLAASLYRNASTYGLSLGDRACLALAKTLNLTVLTADRD
jgi:ribonuclease VapC